MIHKTLPAAQPLAEGGGLAAEEAPTTSLTNTAPPTDSLGDPSVDPDASFLGEDMSQVDTSMPLVKEQPATLEIIKVEKKPTKDGKGFLLAFSLKATTDLETVKGDIVNKGFPFRTNISITVTADNTEDMIKKRCALFVQAMKGTKLFPLSQWEGQLAPCRITIRKERTDKNTGETYPASNEVKFVKE